MKSAAPFSAKFIIFGGFDKMVLAATLKRNIFFFKFYFSNVNLFMSYIEPNFIEKFFRESGFSNFGHVTIFAKWKLVHVYWPPFRNGKCF